MKNRPAAMMLCFVALLAVSAAGCSAELQPVNVDKEGRAIKGYDPVAYFTDGRPVRGDEKYSFPWKDARWLFSSQEHLDMFRADPEQYAPQYGGY